MKVSNNMLKVDDDNKIQLTRGDTARFEVGVKNEVDDSEYELEDGDILRFTVKKSSEDENSLIQKKITSGTLIHIEPEDTKSLPCGKYTYDVELTTKNGDVYTIIPPTGFTLLKEVTW